MGKYRERRRLHDQERAMLQNNFLYFLSPHDRWQKVCHVVHPTEHQISNFFSCWRQYFGDGTWRLPSDAWMLASEDSITRKQKKKGGEENLRRQFNCRDNKVSAPTLNFLDSILPGQLPFFRLASQKECYQKKAKNSKTNSIFNEMIELVFRKKTKNSKKILNFAWKKNVVKSLIDLLNKSRYISIENIFSLLSYNGP